MHMPRRHPRYADVVATVALILAMSGTAYAVTAVKANSVNTAAIQDGAVTEPKIASNAVTSAKVVDGSIGTFDLTDGSVGSADLAPNAVNGAKVADESLTLADLVGANKSGAISFSQGANSCGNLNLSVSGAQVGQVVLFSATGTTALPASVVLGFARVTAANTIVVRACNVSSSSVSVSNLGVRVVTFG